MSKPAESTFVGTRPYPRLGDDPQDIPTDGIDLSGYTGVDLPHLLRAIYCGTAGTVVVITQMGTTLTYVVPTGGRVIMSIRRVVSGPANMIGEF